MIVLDYVLLALAVARATRLITTDALLEAPRERFWRRYPPESSKLGYLITCDWCTSVYISSAFVLMYKIATEATTTIALILALSYVAGSLNRAN